MRLATEEFECLFEARPSICLFTTGHSMGSTLPLTLAQLSELMKVEDRVCELSNTGTEDIYSKAI